MNCPNCRSANPAEARFCSNCGHALGAPPQEHPAFNLDRYIPRELAARLQAARAGGQAAGERRVITCLFCDISGSTAAAERLDPEEWSEIMNGAFEHMIRPIYRYEGTVARLMGDAVLAFFGAPIAHEDDPQRAVLAGLEIQAGMAPYQREIAARHGVEFSARVGINTGLVVVGEVGSDLRMEYTAIGDAVNLAARMEQTAAPGSVQISAETHKLIAPFFDFEDLGGLAVKGKAAPVHSFRVLAVRKVPGQLRGLEGLNSPLVGRDAELARLEERLEALRQGSGSVVAVVGEAGLGKSALVAEARRRSGKSAAGPWFEGQALSYTRSTSYYPWREVIRQSIGAVESDAPAQVREKLRFGCECCSLPGGDLPFLEAILAVESGASLETLKSHQGEELLERITEAARGYLCGLAAESPVVVVLDDLHWADEASLTLLDGLLDLVTQNPLLFICMARPDAEAPSWKLIESLPQKLAGSSDRIWLEPLGPQESARMVGNLLGLDDPPRGLRELILGKAEGNPFFVEEIIRALIDSGQIAPADAGWRLAGEPDLAALPNTLGGLLAARIDRLPEAGRQVLQTAAVLGRSFEARLLGGLLEGAPSAGDQLPGLVQSGLILPVGTQADEVYMFRHVLIQEAAYTSILLKRRRGLHLRAAEALEAVYADRLEEFAAVLAGHFHAAQDPRALRYDILAGEAAARLYASAEAATHFGRALETARRLGAGPEQVGGLFGSLGEALEGRGRYEQALENYLQMESYAREHAAPGIELAALESRARIYSTFTSVHDPALADEALRRALELARTLGDEATQARLHWHLMLTYLFSKRLAQAAEHGQAALALARRGEDREQLAFILNDLARVQTSLGKFGEAFPLIEEARGLWRALGNQAMLSDNLGVEAEGCYPQGEFGRMIEVLNQALELNQRIENIWGQSYARILLSLAYFALGESGRALEMAAEGIRLGDLSGLQASSIGTRCDLAWMLGQYGATDRGLSVAAEALDLANAKQPAWRALPLAAQARLHLLRGDLAAAAGVAGDEPLEPVPIPYPHYTILVGLANVELAVARADFERALSFTDSLWEQVAGLTKPGLAEILCSRAKALLGLGRLEQARASLQDAQARAAAIGADQSLWPALASLARLESRAGEGERAEAYRAAARAVVERIAARLASSGLRESFLARPDVSELFPAI